MKIVVCVKPNTDGELGPFDASAYEAALQIPNGSVTLLSMAPQKAVGLLERLTRLGAEKAVLLSDSSFSGADTLATGYTLSLALKELSPDLILCGRQTMDGDTAQVGIGIAARMGYALASRVMKITEATENSVCCILRNGQEKKLPYPALLTVERAYDLRLPSIRSKKGSVLIRDAKSLNADLAECGSNGSPTKVVKIFENQSGLRKCQKVLKESFEDILQAAMRNESTTAFAGEAEKCAVSLENVWVYGNAAVEMARKVSDDIHMIEPDTAENIAEKIRNAKPSAVFWDSSDEGKELAAKVAVYLRTGLCADCTELETDGTKLYMYRPAFSGNVIAKIVCRTAPPMATLRTKVDSANVIFGIGAGAAKFKDLINRLAEKYGAQVVASRAVVDSGEMKYETQVGLTGKVIAPKVYVAFGISGAVHHIAGIQGAETVIAVNCDKNARIFDYANYGIISSAKDVLEQCLKQ